MDKFNSFGLSTKEVDGNSVQELNEILSSTPFEKNKVSLIIANTVKGKGISFMENEVVWHHKVPSEEQYNLAQKELEKLKIKLTMIERANLEIFAETLLELAKKDKNIIVVTSDSRGSGKLTNFGKELPEQIIEVGIAEQNLVGICRFISSWKKVFGVSPSSFLTARSLEQIKNDIAYSDHPVTLVGISAGVSYGQLGSTHHSIHDIAVLRAINNIDIVIPADNFETKEAIKSAVNYKRPLFIRFGKKPMMNLHNSNHNFKIGHGIKLKSGNDLVIVSTGETVQ